MVEAVLLAATFASTYLGFALLALRQKSHFRAVVGHPPEQRLPPSTSPPRLLPQGIVCLAAGLCCSLFAEGPSFGSLLWVLTLASMSVAVTFTLTWRPRWLRVLVRLGVSS